ncbi:MAG: hypothetical protein V7727_02175 [Sneathiella sp.]
MTALQLQIDRLEDLLSSTHSTMKKVKEIRARLMGGWPENSEEGKDVLPAPGMVGEVEIRIDRLQAVLSETYGHLECIESGLGDCPKSPADKAFAEGRHITQVLAK